MHLILTLTLTLTRRATRCSLELTLTLTLTLTPMQFMMLSDWTKALAVWLVAPWFVLVLLLSALNQWIRVHVRRALMVDKARALRLRGVRVSQPQP